MRRAHRAQAALEFALAMPVLILLIFGVLDAGRAVVAAVSLDNAAVEGARYAALHVNDSTCTAPGTPTCQVEVRALVSNVALGIDSAQIQSDTTLTVPSVPTPPPVTGPVTVVIAYKFIAMTPFINGIAGAFPITARSSMLAR